VIRHLREIHHIKGSHIEIAVKVIGLVSTAIFGMLAFLKGWHYAEINLPKRLVDVLERIKNFTLQDRGL
jgi:hypothetical protein